MLAGAQVAAAQAAPRVGVVCTVGAPGNPTFTLTTNAGYINLPDGNTMYMWGFSEAGKPFQHPGPVLCVNEGDTVTVVLQNRSSDEAVSIIFPGQEDVLANGAPAQPQFDGRRPHLADQRGADPAGASPTPSSPARPGTFLYESGTEPQKQVRMGLFGALVVRPAAGAELRLRPRRQPVHAGRGVHGPPLRDRPLPAPGGRAGRAFNMNNYHPRYWLVNGRGFPDSIADNGASWLPSQPYGALARVHPEAARQPCPG